MKSLKIPMCKFTRPEYWDGLMIVTLNIMITVGEDDDDKKNVDQSDEEWWHNCMIQI